MERKQFFLGESLKWGDIQSVKAPPGDLLAKISNVIP